jgi:hypothetical protein
MVLSTVILLMMIILHSKQENKKASRKARFLFWVMFLLTAEYRLA